MTSTQNEKGVYIEEVLVTAEKRSENIQDIPIAISAFSNKEMEKSGIKGLKDLVHIAPSLNFGDTDGNSYISMRGIGSEIPNGGTEPGVIVSQDGVPFLSQFLFDAIFMDVDRVEVLRGPQGTIAGRNATGGALNIISRSPTEEFDASVKFTLGGYKRRAIEGFVNGALSDKVDGRIAFGVDNADGYLKNTLTGQRVNNIDRKEIRLSLRADLSDEVEALLMLDAIDDGRDIMLSMMHEGVRSDLPSPAQVLGLAPENIPDFENLEFRTSDPTFFQKDTYSAVLKLTADIGAAATLTSTSGYIDFNYGGGGDYDGTPLRLSDIPFLEIDHRQLSQELTLAADISDNMDLILGGLYLRASLDFPLEFASADGFGFGRSLIIHNDHQELESYAVYGQWRYQFSDNWRLSLGGRYTRDTKEYLNDGFFFGCCLMVEGEESWSSFTPKVTIDYQPSNDATVYFSISKGFKAGGFNSFQSVAPDEFDPESLVNYEVGYKAAWLDNRVKSNLAVFYMDYKSVQQNIFLALAPNVVNAGDATVKGAEVELDALVSANLAMRFSATWLDAEFKTILTEDPDYPELGVRDLTGNRLSRAPEWQISAGGEYTVDFAGDMTASLRIDYAFKDHVYHSFFNHENIAQGAYGLLNASIEIAPQSQRWALSLFGTNLLDKRYFSNSFTSTIASNYKSAAIGEPRLYGAALTFNF